MKKIITLIVALLAIATGAWADKTVINYVEITASPDFSTIPKLGASVQTKPTVTVTKGAPAYFHISAGNGDWHKKNGDEWVQVSSGIFTPGTWRFETQIRIDGDDAFFYVLSETPTVKVNGEEWQVNSYFYGVGDNYSCIPVYSPEYVVEEGDLEPPTVITEIEATSDIASIPEVGGTPIAPTFNVTTDVPAYFKNMGWERKNEYGAFIRDNYDTFTPGNWKYCCYVRIPEDEALKYKFQNPTVKVNGETWTVRSWTDTQIFVESTSYILKGPLTQISEVEVTAEPDFSTIPKLGASVQTKPTVTVTKGAPAYFHISAGNGDWHKKNADEWEQVSSGIFTPGTWRFQTQVRIDGDDAFFYVLSETPTVKVNGEEWQVNSNFYGVGDEFSFIPVYSPEYIVEEGDLEPRTVITEIEATSDIASIPEVGGTPIDPTFNVTTDVPAYFENMGWKRKNEYGAFIRDNYDTFTPGSWNYSCYVRIPDDEALKYEFQNPTVKVNGETWTVKGWTDTQIFVESTEYDMNIHATGISINPTILKFNDIGQTAQVTATLQPEDATVYYYFGTTNSNVAQVDYRSGVVTANGFGTCQIYAYTKEEPSKIAYCYVRVESVPKVSLVKGISTDLPNLPVIGEPLKTKPTISVIKGVPAYFSIDDTNGWWQKKVGNEWQYVFGNTFTSGTWRFECQVRIDNEIGSDNQYVLDDNVKVMVNGKEWERAESSQVEIGDYYSYITVFSPEMTAKEYRTSGNLGTQGTWEFADGVLTIDYDGAMPDCTKDETDPDVAYRLQWIDFLADIKEVVVKGVDVEIQPFFLYFEGDGPSGSHPDDHIKKVTLSSGVKSIGRQAFALYDLKQFCCYSIEPPTLSSYTNSNTGYRCFWRSRIEANKAYLILQPGASSGYYIADREWMFFANLGGGFLSNLRAEDDPVGIKAVESLTPALSEGEGDWYDLNGRKLSAPQKGINIIRYSDGTSKKVLVR